MPSYKPGAEQEEKEREYHEGCYSLTSEENRQKQREQNFAMSQAVDAMPTDGLNKLAPRKSVMEEIIMRLSSQVGRMQELTNELDEHANRMFGEVPAPAGHGGDKDWPLAHMDRLLAMLDRIA